MSEPGITLKELLAFTETSTKRWRHYFEENQEALEVPCDIYNSGNVRGFLRHIFAVELRHSQRLLAEDVTPYEALKSDTLAGLYEIHEKAMQNLRRFLSGADAETLNEQIAIQTVPAGTLHASRRKLFAHVVLHSVRHWAQMATLLRDKGFKTDWPKDLLFSEAIL
jgi:uncharacterized damage-inducible protein DinB